MSINIENKHINSIIQNQQHLKEILINYMQQIVDSTNYINLDYADDIVKFLEELRNSLNYCNQNIVLLKGILKTNNSEPNDETLETVFKNTLKIENFLFSALSFSELKFFNHTHNIEKDTKTTETNFNNEFKENTLIISETKGKIFLPYKISELEKIQKENPDKYSSIADIIAKDYTLPFESFKNLSIARFREAFKLVRNVEKKSIKSAFDLGMELIFNYNLHPAIIAACKSLDELDIYLDYLENNETDKFDCFKIIFEMAPVVSKKRS